MTEPCRRSGDVRVAIGILLVRIGVWLLGADFVVVPTEPTGRMIREACKQITDADREGKDWMSNKDKHRLRWHRMLAAAPRITDAA